MTESTKAKTWIKNVGLMLVPISLVIGLRLWALSRQTPHLEKIASEIGSVPQYRVGLHHSYSGSSLIFFQESEMGLKTFFCETATGKTRLLYEEKENGYGNRFRLLGWSPDDRILGFVIFADSEETNASKTITLCNGLTGEVVSRIPAGGIAGDAQFVWLSPHAFVYSTFTHRAWLLYEENPDGSWAQTQSVKRFSEGRLQNVTAISPHSIAWLDKGAVWIYDFASGGKRQIWKTTTNELTGLAFSAKSGDFSLRCKDAHGAFVMELSPPRDGNTEAEIVRVIRPLPPSRHMEVAMEAGKFIIKMKPARGTNQSVFVWDGMMHFFDGELHYYALCGDDLYFLGSQMDGIPGIWQYNFKSHEVRQVISALQSPLKLAKLTEPTVGIYTNEAGKEVSYHLWPPVNKVSGEKYPIVLAKDLHVWNPFQQAASSAGCFYAHLDLTDWNFDTWPEDVAGLCRILSKNPEIDTNKIFFLASSGQNARVARLVSQQVVAPKGLILYHPSGLEDLTGVRVKNILLLGGTDDNKNASVESLHKLQDDAINEGDCMHLTIQDGVQHLTRSVASERNETIQFARFLDQTK